MAMPGLDHTLAALADPTRRAILQRLAQGEARVTELARPFAMSLNSVSKHIRMLERARLVRRRRAGREHLMSFNREPLDEATAWIDAQRAFWTARLDALERELREAETSQNGGARMGEFGGITATGLRADVERAEQAMSEFGVVTAVRTVRFQRVLPGPIEHVWAYLTESEKRGRWLASGPMELRVDGRVELTFHNADLTPHAEAPPDRYKKCEGGVVHGRVTRCDPPRLLSYTWREPAGDESEVTFELTPQGDSVLLELTHRRLPDRTTMVSVAAGWHTHLGILVDRLIGREPPPFWSRYARLEAEYQEQLPAE